MMKKICFLFALFFGAILSCQSQDGSRQTSAPYQDINVAEFSSKMAEPDVVILDVRTPDEVAQGKIEGAIILDYYDDNFAKSLDKLDKNKTYLIYCRSGNRSGKTCKLMSEKGFTKLYNLAGGYNAWSEK